MKEAKKGTCIKCNIYFYIHDHHILPKSKFGKNGKTAALCPNCHTHFHEYSKQKTINPYDAKEAQHIWDTWLKYISVIVSMIVMGLLVHSFS